MISFRVISIQFRSSTGQKTKRILDSTVMRMLLIVTAFCCSLKAETRDADAFTNGLGLLQTQKFADAVVEFEKALSEEPQNTHILYNLGLAHYRLGQKGWAAACWRKALILRPDLREASKSLAILDSELPSSRQEVDESLWNQIQTRWAAPVSWSAYFFVLWLTLSAGGFLWLRYFAKRRELSAEELEGNGIPFPSSAALLSTCFLLLLGMMTLKWIDQRCPRATIVAETVSVRLTPDKEAQQLSEALQGQQVELLQSYGDWAQVSLSSGTVGWILKNSLFQTAGRPLW